MSPDDIRHGTPAGVNAHRRARQDPCRACLDARNAYERETLPRLASTSARDEIDDVVILRIIGGDWRLHASPAEKAEVCRRWVARGGSLRQLARFTGWKPGRYYKAQLDSQVEMDYSLSHERQR